MLDFDQLPTRDRALVRVLSRHVWEPYCPLSLASEARSILYMSRTGAGLEDAYFHLVPLDAPVDFQARLAESIHAIWVWLHGRSERAYSNKYARLLQLIDLAAVRVAEADKYLPPISYN